MNNNSVGAIVVTYHPGTSDLENLSFLRPQVNVLVVVDNGSSANELRSLRKLKSELGFVLIENSENLGIATALNQGVSQATDRGCTWINLFDQDSRITPEYIKTMVDDFGQLSQTMRLGLLVPRYRNPETGAERLLNSRNGIGPFVTITSGSLFKAETLKKCGPFQDELFIYIVDDEYSLRLRLKGFEIAQSKRAVLLHTAGNPKPVRVLGKEIFTRTNHSPISRYYLNRNRIWLARHYGRSFPAFCACLAIYAVKEAAKIALAEEQKFLKLLRIAQGIRDGLLGKMGRAHLSNP